MEYIKLKCINKYKSKSINPAKTPDEVFEVYSVPIYGTGHPEYLCGREIASSKILVQKNDILLCKINPRINRVWVVPDESDKVSIASSEWIVIRNDEYNPDFLAWYFRTPKFQKYMISEVTGIGGSLTRAQPKCVAEYPVPVVDKMKQDEIVNVLNRCKFIIESRKQELEKLDILIKARFVEMFGDILCDSNLPLIQLKELADIGSSKRIYANEYVESGVPFYRSKEIRELGMGIKPSVELFIKQERYDEIKEKYGIPKVGDILVAAIGATIGYSWIVDSEKPFYYKDGNLIILSIKNNVNPIFLNHTMRILIEDFKNKGVAGSAQLALTIEKLEKMMVINPDIELQNQFADFVRAVDKSKVEVQKALDEAQLLFDSLMQEYFG